MILAFIQRFIKIGSQTDVLERKKLKSWSHGVFLERCRRTYVLNHIRVDILGGLKRERNGK